MVTTNAARERGFTVVELVCAFAVLSVIAIAMVHNSNGNSATVHRAFRETVALRTAQAQIESVRGDGAALLVDKQPFDLGSAAQSLPRGVGTRAVRAIGPGLFEVEVTVSWQARTEQTLRTVRLTTRIAQPEADK